jgi:hypothetical protein
MKNNIRPSIFYCLLLNINAQSGNINLDGFRCDVARFVPTVFWKI